MLVKNRWYLLAMWMIIFLSDEEIGSQGLNERIDDLKHRICVEWRISEGAKNMLKIQNPDKKAVNETKERILECERKIAILKYSLEKRMFEQQLQNASEDEARSLPAPSVNIIQIAAQGATLAPDTNLYR